MFKEKDVVKIINNVSNTLYQISHGYDIDNRKKYEGKTFKIDHFNHNKEIVYLRNINGSGVDYPDWPVSCIEHIKNKRDEYIKKIINHNI